MSFPSVCKMKLQDYILLGFDHFDLRLKDNRIEFHIFNILVDRFS